MKKLLLICGLLLVTGAAGLWFFGRPAYRHFRERRAMDQAREFMAKSDYQNASLSARQALMLNATNLEAAQIMANIAEMARTPMVVDWLQRIASMDPNVTNKLRLATAVLRYQGPPFPLAAQVLQELSATASNVPAYQLASAELALKLGNPADAELCFDRATRLEPTNDMHAFNLAVLRLRSTDATLAAQARATLEQLTSNTNLGPAGLRWLINDSMEKRDLAAAEGFSSRLLQDPQGTIEDRLQHLAILKQSKPAEFTAYLENLKTNASTNAVQSYVVASWMNANKMAEQAYQWLTNLPPKLQGEQPLPLALVDSYVARRDWPGLDLYLKEKAWGEAEFIRHACLAQAAFEQHEERAADSRWATALQKAGDNMGALTLLLNTEYCRKVDKAREDLLWKIVRRHPKEKWALRELERLYAKTGSSSSLNKLYSAMTSYDPQDWQARNNFAATALLLRRSLSEAHEAARTVYTAHPDDAIVASTHAYSLHLLGHTKQGLAILEKLPAEKLQLPPVALYYAILLAEDGQAAKAKTFVPTAQKSKLLPEEETLLNEVIRGKP